MRVLIHFVRFGPYHLARLNAAYKALLSREYEMIALETAGEDETYSWSKEDGLHPWKRVTVFPNEAVENLSYTEVSSGVWKCLDDLQPDILVIAGWAASDARACLKWAKRCGKKTIVMSETREADGTRIWWKEWFKSRIVRQFDAALVGGESHARYLSTLGIPEDRIKLGYNVVDNTYFTNASRCWKEKRETSRCTRKKYFLASNRFIERKNIHRLIRAYTHYLTKNQSDDVWDLCLVGDGELKGSLIEECSKNSLKVCEKAPWEVEQDGEPVVYFPGFRQIEELPRFYAYAGCFIHPALVEPWGLVFNEAMATGLPIISGGNVGAAEELVDDGVNGYIVDATEMGAIADAMLKVAGRTVLDLEQMGEMSAKILEERAPTHKFGDGILKAVEAVYAI